MNTPLSFLYAHWVGSHFPWLCGLSLGTRESNPVANVASESRKLSFLLPGCLAKPGISGSPFLSLPEQAGRREKEARDLVHGVGTVP